MLSVAFCKIFSPNRRQSPSWRWLHVNLKWSSKEKGSTEGKTRNKTEVEHSCVSFLWNITSRVDGCDCLFLGSVTSPMMSSHPKKNKISDEWENKSSLILFLCWLLWIHVVSKTSLITSNGLVSQKVTKSYHWIFPKEYFFLLVILT